MLPRVFDPDLLVGSDTLDDAAVYRVRDDLALVQTVDFFTPIVDDPYDFGRIAAANALSDIYAMGATPLTALNIVCFPSQKLPLEYLGQILRGGADVAAQAKVTIVGGHTIDDPEPKYGLAVTGLVQPGQQLTNSGARPGDQLVLTKPLGTGIIATAIKKGVAPSIAIRAATDSMTALNKTGAEVARMMGAHAVTDVTGFGLLGHLSEMCQASGVSARLWFSRLPLLPEVESLIRSKIVPGGTLRNLEFALTFTQFAPNLEEWQKIVCADAQTSGGLLLALPRDSVQEALTALAAGGVCAAHIGEFVERQSFAVEVLG